MNVIQIAKHFFQQGSEVTFATHLPNFERVVAHADWHLYLRAA